MRACFQLDTRLNQINSFRKLNDEPQEFWVQMVNNWLVNGKSVTVSTTLRLDNQTIAKGHWLRDRGTMLFVGLLKLSFIFQIVGEPSTQLMKEMGDEEKARVAEQVKQLGDAGLKNKGEILQKATEENEVHFCGKKRTKG